VSVCFAVLLKTVANEWITMVLFDGFVAVD